MDERSRSSGTPSSSSSSSSSTPIITTTSTSSIISSNSSGSVSNNNSNSIIGGANNMERKGNKLIPSNAPHGKGKDDDDQDGSSPSLSDENKRDERSGRVSPPLAEELSSKTTTQQQQQQEHQTVSGQSNTNTTTKTGALLTTTQEVEEEEEEDDNDDDVKVKTETSAATTTSSSCNNNSSKATTTATDCGNVNNNELRGNSVNHGETRGVCDSRSSVVDQHELGEPDIGIAGKKRSSITTTGSCTGDVGDGGGGQPSGGSGANSPTVSTTTTTIIDPSSESTKVLECAQQPTEGELKGNNTKFSSLDLLATEAGDTTATDKGAAAAATLSSNSAASSSSSTKPPVPNFRVEGSGAGDSSITVAVASLSSAVSASVTLHSSGGRGGGSTGGSNSLENGEQPGSSSGPVSIQSSEEMRLSLVSWYSEPEDPSRLIEGCCSALNTYRHENGIAEEVVSDRDICGGSSGSMGHEVTNGSAVANGSSPACKSESEEKENKTPEPGGNLDKMSGGSGGDSHLVLLSSDGFSKTELVNLNPNDNNTKKSDCGGGGSETNHDNSSGACTNKRDETQGLISKSGGGEGGVVGGSCNNNKIMMTSSSNSSKSVDVVGKSAKHSNSCSSSSSSAAQKAKGHNVQLSDQKQLCSGASSGGGGHNSRGCHQDGGSSKSMKPECPRCSRRSKSGTTTPASGTQIARNRTPASRRVVQSCKSSTEIKKPIKSILKHDSRGSAGSGSGSDKQSSMDSLGSSGDIGVTPVHILRGRLPNSLMTRSDSGTRARFNFQNTNICPPDTPTGAPEDRVVSKLKRIEKYATLRVRKPLKPRPLELSDSETTSNDVHNGGGGGVMSNSSHGKTGVPGVPNELMSKSMSYLEKSSSTRVHISSAHGHPYGESTSASSTLKRQGSLRMKKHNTPQWEPSGTRTSALRLQKMQEAKAKNSPGGGAASSGSANSGSAHSGSGDSLHYLPHSANSTSASGSGGSSGMSSIHLAGVHSAPSTHARMTASAAAKEKHMGAKIFSKLSSALGQTASSNQKRLRQERGIQTDVMAASVIIDPNNRMSLSPIPTLESGTDATEQIKSLERMCNRYRNQVFKIQSDFERSESRKVELLKQMEEAQHESNEMIEFLQAEKSTLAESLTEVEVEAKKWKDEIDAMKQDYQSRCSSLVRLSEQHKQEALKSQALLHRLESQSTSVISQLSHQITDGAQNMRQTILRVTALTDSLLKTYKVPPELLASSETNQTIKETDLSCSLLLPLITSLSAAFPMVTVEPITSKSHSSSAGNTPGKPSTVSNPSSSDVDMHGGKGKVSDPAHGPSTSLTMTESSSFQSLNQAILEREAAEKSGLDDIMKPFSLCEGVSPDADQLSLKKEITELNAAIAKLLNVVRVIVIHCDRKVSSVASSILQCLKSIEDDKVGNIAEIAQVQKSLEAWSDKGMSDGSTTTTSNGSPPCKTTLTSTTVVGATGSTYLVGNGHAHV